MTMTIPDASASTSNGCSELRHTQSGEGTVKWM